MVQMTTMEFLHARKASSRFLTKKKTKKTKGHITNLHPMNCNFLSVRCKLAAGEEPTGTTTQQQHTTTTTTTTTHNNNKNNKHNNNKSENSSKKTFK